jgi:hypothetical protein
MSFGCNWVAARKDNAVHVSLSSSLVKQQLASQTRIAAGGSQAADLCAVWEAKAPALKQQRLRENIVRVPAFSRRSGHSRHPASGSASGLAGTKHVCGGN